MIQQQPTVLFAPQWFLYALGEYGQKEVPGAGSNPRIDEYLKSCPTAGMQGDETPWCSGFVNWCITRAGHKGTGSLAARSWQGWGTKAITPRLGCVAVLWRESPTSPKGHVAFLVRQDGGTVWLLGGNQTNGVAVQAYPTARVLDYRLPR